MALSLLTVSGAALCADSAVTYTVQDSSEGYSSWPMMQAMGDKLICTYSKGAAHTPEDPLRKTCFRTSVDGGKTWSEEVQVVNTTGYGDVPTGKGLDENRNMLLWVRSLRHVFHGKELYRDFRHSLFRTSDGVKFEKIAEPELTPAPVQISDVFHVPGTGMMALWFSGLYRKSNENAWGTLVSRDNGITWKQTTVESGISRDQWPTELSAAVVGKDGRILVIARCEEEPKNGGAQFQLESLDGGKTWKKYKTNINDVLSSTPSIIYDRASGIVSNYYFQRGKGLLKRRTAHIDNIFGRPQSWSEPEIIAEASSVTWDAGNVNAVRIGSKDYLAYYSGNKGKTAVLVTVADMPVK